MERRFLLMLAALLVATGCAPEDADLPLAPPELAVAGALVADSTDGEDDGLVCEWEPVAEREGEVVVSCYREGNGTVDGGEDAGATANDDCRCWYWVYYRCRRMDCTKIDEDFLGCDPGCLDGMPCSPEQIDIAGEYANINLYNPDGGPRRNWSGRCDLFDDRDFVSGTGTHGHSVGYIDALYRGNKRTVSNSLPGQLTVTSDWRCPQGNANLPNPGSIGSWHMEGNGGDFAKRNGHDLTYDEWNTIQQSAGRAGAGGISRWGDPCQNCFQYKAHIHVDWRPS